MMQTPTMTNSNNVAQNGLNVLISQAWMKFAMYSNDGKFVVYCLLFFVPSFSTTIIVPCDAPFIVPFFIQQISEPGPDNNRDGEIKRFIGFISS